MTRPRLGGAPPEGGDLPAPRRRLELVADTLPPSDDATGACLDEALATLWLAAQPIVRASTRAVYAYELLLRTRSATLTSPPALLDAAERQGRLVDVGRRVREEAARRAAMLDGDARLFVNLHPAELLDPALGRAGDPLLPCAHRVTFEVTERASLDGLHGVGAAVARLRAAGFHIALDDLGCGYAGLTSLANLAPHVVKLDMSLVRGIDGDALRATLVRAMVELCRQLGADIVAEGVETAAERDTLVGLGCDLLQGYLFARPGPGFPIPAPSAFP